MSRHRIMNRVWRAVHKQVPQIAPLHQLTRRDLLKLGSLAIGSLALPRASWGRVLTRTPRIGIVGAGISGMTAALTFQDHGFSCSVFEASDRIGGRMHSNTTLWKQGQVSEWCGEFINTQHYLVRQLARRFGLTLVDVNAAAPPNSQDTNYFLGSYYTEQELSDDVKVVAPILFRQQREVGPTVLYKQYNRAGYDFDHLSAYDWIEAFVPGGHSSRLGRYLDVALVTEDGGNTQQQSSLNLILFGSNDERFHIKGGNEQLPRAIAANLPAGTINLGWRLTAVMDNGDKTVGLSFQTPDGVRELTFDYVILTLPFSVLRRLNLSEAGFDPLKLTAIRQVGYGTNSKLVLQFDQRYWNGFGEWPGKSDGFIATDLFFQSTWDSSRAEPGHDGLLTNYTGGTNGAVFRPEGPYTTSLNSPRTAEYAKKFLAQLEQVWPGGSSRYNGLAALGYPTGDPNLLGSYSTYKVGQYTQFGGYERVPQGRIFFGGEHTSINYQGFMEGGAEEGRRAALEVLAATG